MTITDLKTNSFRTFIVLVFCAVAIVCGVLLHFVNDVHMQSLLLRGLVVDAFVAAILLVREVRSVSRRVTELRLQLQRIQVSGNPSSRLVIAGSDEVHAIAVAINNLLTSAELGTRIATKERVRMHAQALRFSGQVESLTMKCETSYTEWDISELDTGPATMPLHHRYGEGTQDVKIVDSIATCAPDTVERPNVSMDMIQRMIRSLKEFGASDPEGEGIEQSSNGLEVMRQ